MDTEQMSLHLVGTHVTHSVAYDMHNFIAKSLGLPWTFYSTTCATLDDVLKLLESLTAGLVVTIPFKNTVMRRVNEVDNVSDIGPCNCSYYKKSSQGRTTCGSNTDWNWIVDSLLAGEAGHRRPTAAAPGSALVVGAGGASRAAVYSPVTYLHCDTIYIINRDDAEVAALIEHSGKHPTVLRLIHLRSLDETKVMGPPYYVLGTVPDFEPQTDSEKNVVTMLDAILAKPS